LEDPIIKILADYPESLGKGSSLLMISPETEAGVINIMLQDVIGNRARYVSSSDYLRKYAKNDRPSRVCKDFEKT